MHLANAIKAREIVTIVFCRKTTTKNQQKSNGKAREELA